jgi:hypothetical protein
MSHKHSKVYWVLCDLCFTWCDVDTATFAHAFTNDFYCAMVQKQCVEDLCRCI